MARFIHQAMVRRSVVVKLIDIMSKRGHRAYAHIDIHEVIAKASALPEHDVPPEIVRLLPLDKLQDKTNCRTVRRMFQHQQALKKRVLF